ncbi:MAG: hypothetical protein MAG451_00210 [Anaerolineales bacterium]|nr:hypothetical protein [Anaerolineales bacterium]
MDGEDILANLAELPVYVWNYKAEAPTVRHVGPTAQDFYAAFKLGQDDRHISTVDAEGVTFAAIQGLYQVLQEKDAKISAQQQQIANLETRLEALERLVQELDQK